MMYLCFFAFIFFLCVWSPHLYSSQLSLDGKRLYVTSSLFSPWDKQFYPDMCSKVCIISGPILFCHEFCYAFQEKARWKFILLAERGNLYLSWCVIALGLNDVHHWLRHWERWHAAQQRLLRRLWRGTWWPISCSWGEQIWEQELMKDDEHVCFYEIL